MHAWVMTQIWKLFCGFGRGGGGGGVSNWAGLRLRKLFCLFLQGYSRKGSALFKLGQLKEAGEAYRAGLKVEPDNAILKEGLKEVRLRQSEICRSVAPYVILLASEASQVFSRAWFSCAWFSCAWFSHACHLRFVKWMKASNPEFF